jgi:hypothetical protein
MIKEVLSEGRPGKRSGEVEVHMARMCINCELELIKSMPEA